MYELLDRHGARGYKLEAGAAMRACRKTGRRILLRRRAFVRASTSALSGLVLAGLPGLRLWAAPASPIGNDLTPRRNPSLKERHTQRGLLVYTHDAEGRPIGTMLGTVGEQTWRALDGTRTVGQVVSAVQQGRSSRTPIARDVVLCELEAMAEAGVIYFGNPLWEVIRYR